MHHLRTVFAHILGVWEGNLLLGRDLPALEKFLKELRDYSTSKKGKVRVVLTTLRVRG